MWTHASNIWFKGDDSVIVVPCLMIRTYFNSIQTTTPRTPTPYPTLIKYRWKGWTNKLILLPGPMHATPSAWSAIHPHDPWTYEQSAVLETGLLAEIWYQMAIDFYLLQNLLNSLIIQDRPLEQSITVLVLIILEMEEVFKEFLQD